MEPIVTDDAGSLLVRAGLISAHHLHAARQAQAHDGGTIGEYLVTQGLVSDDGLTEFYRTRLLVPQVNPNTLARLPASVIELIPADMALEFRAVPVSVDRDGNLTLAMSDPANRHAVDEIGFFTNKYVVRAVATQMQIAWCLAQYYGFVTELGERLLQPGGESGARAPRTTPAQGSPSRPRGAPPPTIPPPVVTTADRAPTSNAPDDEVEELDSGAVEMVDDGLAPRGRRATAPLTRRATDDAHPPSNGAVSGVIPSEATQPRRKRRALPDPPELAARSGELVDHIVDSRVEPRLASVEVHFEDEPVPAPADEVSETRPVLLEYPRLEPDAVEPTNADHGGANGSAIPTAAAGTDEASGPIVLLYRRKPGELAPSDATRPYALRRVRSSSGERRRQTVIGIGALGPIPRSADLSTADEPSASAAAATDLGSPPPLAPSSEEDAQPAGTAIPAEVAADVESTDAVPLAYDDQSATGRLSSYAARIDKGWSGSGHLVPPTAEDSSPHSDHQSHAPASSPSTPLDPAATGPTGPARPPSPRADSIELARQLGEAADRLLQVLRELDRAQTRTDALRLLVEFVAVNHHRVGFLAATDRHLTSVLQIPPSPDPSAHLDLEIASTLQDVVRSRLLYRGPMPDPACRELVKAMFGSTADDILAVPVTIPNRVVGVLYADGRHRYAFDEHVTTAARAAGLALERILAAAPI